MLSSYPDGKASYASLKSDLAILSTVEWMARMRRLGERAGPIDIFGSKYATRDTEGWAITKAGRDFLDRLERAELVSQSRETESRGLSGAVSSEEAPTPQPPRARLKLVKSA